MRMSGEDKVVAIACFEHSASIAEPGEASK
jgi:hypothetical protein